MATPYVTIVHDEVSSTQDVAVAALEEHARAVLIVANRQTAGRGRHGNDWWQAPRGVAASLAIPDGTLVEGSTFTLTVGLAVRAAIRSVTQLDVQLKWPNDITVGAGKVGGILAQRNAGVTVVGCGLNLWWPEPPAGATGLFEQDPGPSVGLQVSQHWAHTIVAGAQPWDRDAYKAVCATLGEEVTWLPAGKGRAVDVDDDGALVVDTGRGLLALRSGEVHTVRNV